MTWCTYCGMHGHDAADCKRERIQDAAPVRYDIERMKKALEGPSYMAPSGLNKTEILAYLNQISKGLK